MTGFAGTVCKNCSKTYHVCNSCGVETFYFDYCSTKCLREAGYVICDKCDCSGFTTYCKSDQDCPGYRPAEKDEPRSKTIDEQMNDLIYDRNH